MNVSVRIYLKATRQYLIRIQFKITDEGLVLEVQLIKLIVTIDRALIYWVDWDKSISHIEQVPHL